MEYTTTGSIPAVFENGKVVITVNGGQIDLMAVESMEDMRVVLSALSFEAMTRAMSQAMAPPPKEEPESVELPPNPDMDIEGYAEKIRQSFQDQATKAQERLNDLASLNESANQ